MTTKTLFEKALDFTLNEDNIKNPDAYQLLEYKRTWDALDLNDVNDPRLAVCAFDTAVQVGVSKARQWLDRTESEGRSLNYFLNFRIIDYLQKAKKNPQGFTDTRQFVKRVNELKKYVMDPEVITPQ